MVCRCGYFDETMRARSIHLFRLETSNISRCMVRSCSVEDLPIQPSINGMKYHVRSNVAHIICVTAAIPNKMRKMYPAIAEGV